MNYSVKYREIGSFFWSKLKDVKADSTLMSEGLAVRVFILSDDSRVEMPSLITEIKFSKERHFTVIANMEKEAGQKLPLN